MARGGCIERDSLGNLGGILIIGGEGGGGVRGALGSRVGGADWTKIFLKGDGGGGGFVMEA